MEVAVVVEVALLLTHNILLWQTRHILLPWAPVDLLLLQVQLGLTVEVTQEMDLAATVCLDH
jgi:hypothetical protein